MYTLKDSKKLLSISYEEAQDKIATFRLESLGNGKALLLIIAGRRLSESGSCPILFEIVGWQEYEYLGMSQVREIQLRDRSVLSLPLTNNLIGTVLKHDLIKWLLECPNPTPSEKHYLTLDFDPDNERLIALEGVRLVEGISKHAVPMSLVAYDSEAIHLDLVFEAKCLEVQIESGESLVRHQRLRLEEIKEQLDRL